MAELSVALLFSQGALLQYTYITINEPFFEFRLRRTAMQGRAGGRVNLRQSSSHSLDCGALLQKGRVLLYYCALYLLTDI
jgi:hypothetical protein